jgi:hypothetical protein
MPSVTGFQFASMRLSGVRSALERGVPTVPVSGSVPVPLARLSDVLLRAGTGGRSAPCASSCASSSTSTGSASGVIGERGGGGLPSRGTGGLIIRMGGLNTSGRAPAPMCSAEQRLVARRARRGAVPRARRRAHHWSERAWAGQRRRVGRACVIHEARREVPHEPVLVRLRLVTREYRRAVERVRLRLPPRRARVG